MRSSLLILILITLAVAACQPAPPATTDAPPPMETQVETQSPLPTVAQTSPPAGVTEAYPPPQKSGAYPAPGQAGAAITWEEAVALILEGKVAEVIQNQSLTVSLTLKDGQVFTTTEPLLDEVLQIIEQCGAVCQDIVQKTE